MNIQKGILILLGSIAAISSVAQINVVGVWKGTSICQVKNSSCHDEQVVYHITKDVGANNYQVDGNKIVDGKEEPMGILSFILDATKGTFISIDEKRGVRWEFNVKDKQMSGKLISKGTVFRIVELKKED